MSTQYTAIYVETWMAGSHMHSITKFRRIEQHQNETVGSMLIREQLEDQIQFLFLGWPKLQGE